MNKQFNCLVFVVLAFFFSQCKQDNKEMEQENENQEVFEVKLEKGEKYEKILGKFGMEDRATIEEQAGHFAISEINRGQDLRDMVYTYQPAEGYSGEDEVLISLYTGDIGDGKSGKTSYVKFKFEVE